MFTEQPGRCSEHNSCFQCTENCSVPLCRRCVCCDALFINNWCIYNQNDSTRQFSYTSMHNNEQTDDEGMQRVCFARKAARQVGLGML